MRAESWLKNLVSSRVKMALNDENLIHLLSRFFETSALDGDNVNTVFESMLNNVGKKIQSLIKSGK